MGRGQGCGIKGLIPTSVIQGNPFFIWGVSLWEAPFCCTTEAVISHSPGRGGLQGICFGFKFERRGSRRVVVYGTLCFRSCVRSVIRQKPSRMRSGRGSRPQHKEQRRDRRHVEVVVFLGLQEAEPDEISGEPFLPFRRRWRFPEAAPEQVTNDSRARHDPPPKKPLE